MMSKQNKEGIPCKVVIEEDAGMLSEGIVADEYLVVHIDYVDFWCEIAATQTTRDQKGVEVIDYYDGLEES